MAEAPDEAPRLGIWGLEKSTLDDGRLCFYITRNGLRIGDHWIFKGQAVSYKGKLIRREGLAVVQHMRELRGAQT